jgi:hypothetical protein
VPVPYFFTLLLGVVLALHLEMNSEERKSIGNSRVSNASFCCIRALALAVTRTWDCVHASDASA